MARAWDLLYKDRLFLSALLLVALLLRLDFVVNNDFIIDADEAIVGLMAKHINEGAGIPTFYYGQHYMGSLEPLLASFLFRFLGNTNFALQMVPLLFSLGLVLLIYLMGMELGARSLARTAALLCAVPPTSLVIWSTKARGGFIEIVFLGSLALLLTCRWLKSKHKTLPFTLLIGLLLGFGWWTNNQIIYFMLPIGCVMLLALKADTANFAGWCYQTLLHLCSGVLGFFVGGLPFWIYNIQHQFISFKMFSGAKGGEVLEHWNGVFEVALPIILGARRFWDTGDAFPFSTLIVSLLYLSILAILFWARRKEVLELCRFRLDCEKPVELILLFLIASVSVFAFSSFGWLVQAPRYLLPAYTGIFILTAYAFECLREKNSLLCNAGVSMVLAINLLSSYYGGRAIPGEPFVELGERVSKDHSQLIDWLDRNGFRFVRTNYWIGYRLAFETQERIKFISDSPPYCDRIAKYVEEAAKLDKRSMPMVLVPAQAAVFERGLQALGFDYRKIALSGYIVIYGEQPIVQNLLPVERHLLQVSSTHSSEVATQAIDGAIQTRWGSGAHQQPGMQFAITLKEPALLRGLLIEEGSWTHDYPRGLHITLELEDGTVRDLYDHRHYADMLAYLDDGEAPQFYFRPLLVRKVVLTQTGEHPILDWSIAELTLFR